GAKLGIWDWNIKKREVKYNERSAEMLGFSVGELDGPLDHWEKRIHPEDLPRVNKEVERHLRGETEMYKTEHRLKTKSGEWIWVKNVGKLFERDEYGEPVRAIGIHEDITKRKISEQQLEKSEKKFRTIFESANDAIFIIRNGRFEDCNQKALEMFRCEREDIIGKTPHNYSSEKQPDGTDSMEIAKEKMNLALEGEPQKFEWANVTKDGHQFYTDITLNRYIIEDEKFLMAIVRDITERKEWEEHLDKSKKKIIKLQEISAQLQTYDSEEEIYSFAVKAAEDVLDFYLCEINVPGNGEMKSVARSADFPEEVVSEMEPLLIDDSVAGKTYLENRSFLFEDIRNVDYANPRLDNFKSVISIPLGEHGVFQASSKEVGFFDREDLKMAELLMSHVSEALHRIQMKKREDFLHTLLRHDVANKNQIIKGYLELLKDYEISDEAKDFLRKAEHAAKDSIDMIEKIRKLRQIEKEDEVYEMPLDTVIDKVMSENQDMLQEKDIEVDISECGFYVKGGHLLEEMFSNLIANSIQHSNCSKIKISSKTEDDECIVTIEDDGTGISDDIKEKIFERGFKRGKKAGTGLGLYMVREIAESYDGCIEVKDSELGGARFEVRLKKVE
ncbi:MAG: PAS domain S-box protein, partial [Thermoplasmatota archaeon]